MRIPWKVLTVTLAAMLIAGSVAAQETPTPERLTPVQRRAVQAFAADGIFEGTSCSVEDCSGTVQRWEVAMWIIRLFDYRPTPHETFADVDSEQPYAGFVETLYVEEITTGCLFDPLQFCPESPTSRGQMAAFVTRAYDLEGTDPRHGFSDVSLTNVFRDNISTIKNVGILSSDCDEGEQLFCPWQPIAAAEAVEWLYRAKLLGPTTGRDNGGGGGGGGGNGGNGGNGDNGDNGDSDPTPTMTQPQLIPELVGNEDIDLVNGECTHHDRHFHAGGSDRKSYMILDGNYPVSLVFDDEGPYASVSGQNEFFRYDALPPIGVVTHRYRVERNTIRAVYFSHWHVGQDIRWVYWIPETVLERGEDSIADPITDEVLFEDGSGNQYRRLRNERGDLDYGPLDSPPACNDHSHSIPSDTGNYVP